MLSKCPLFNDMSDERVELQDQPFRSVQDENGIDLELLREHLRMTPKQRLDQHRARAEMLFKLNRAAHNSRH
jgi:hypothetical protein